MKTFPFIFSVWVFLIFSTSIFAQADNLSVIEVALNNKEFKRYIAKDEMNKSIPLIVVANNHFSEFLEIDFEGKKVDVFAKQSEANLEDDQVFVDFKKYKIRDNVAIVKFKYNGYTIKIKHKKIKGKWLYSSFSLKGNKKRYFNSVSVE